MFEGPVTGNIPEVLDNGEVTDAVRSRNGPGGKHCGVRQQRGAALAPLATAAALATTDGQVAAHRSSIAALQSSLTTGLSNKANQSAFDVLEGVVATKSSPDGVDLKLSTAAPRWP